MWNTGLAVFSVMAFWSVDSLNLAKKFAVEGIEEATCHTVIYSTSHQALWGFLYCLSKPIELVDTAFIVLRKTPLIFLHWYHHITVMIYSWYCTPYRCATNHILMSMNLFIHSLMYSYYAVKASGYRISSLLAQVITFLQILQMVGGLAINIIAFRVLQRGDDCTFTYDSFYFGMVIYISYLILFGNFFYQRYLSKKQTKMA